MDARRHRSKKLARRSWSRSSPRGLHLPSRAVVLADTFPYAEAPPETSAATDRQNRYRLRLLASRRDIERCLTLAELSSPDRMGRSTVGGHRQTQESR